jgi:hypothetical protein
VTQFLEAKLKLRVNREKSAVARVEERKFLGYRLLSDGRLGIAQQRRRRARPDSEDERNDLSRLSPHAERLTCLTGNVAA